MAPFCAKVLSLILPTSVRERILYREGIEADISSKKIYRKRGYISVETNSSILIFFDVLLLFCPIISTFIDAVGGVGAGGVGVGVGIEGGGVGIITGSGL